MSHQPSYAQFGNFVNDLKSAADAAKTAADAATGNLKSMGKGESAEAGLSRNQAEAVAKPGQTSQQSKTENSKETVASAPEPTPKSSQEFDVRNLKMNVSMKDYIQIVTATLKGSCAQTNYKPGTDSFPLGDVSINCSKVEFFGAKIDTFDGYFQDGKLKYMVIGDMYNESSDGFPEVLKAFAQKYQFKLPNQPLPPRGHYKFNFEVLDVNQSSFVFTANMERDLSGVTFKKMYIEFRVADFGEYKKKRIEVAAEVERKATEQAKQKSRSQI